MNQLEQLIFEWLEFKGYFVRRNVKVGILKHGGYTGELDIVAFNPNTGHILHIEPSTDAHNWKKREERYSKKFAIGKKYIISEVFPWLPNNSPIEQWAVLFASNKDHKSLAGGNVVPVTTLYKIIAKDLIIKIGKKNRVIPEQFPLLRTMHFTLKWVILP